MRRERREEDRGTKEEGGGRVEKSRIDDQLKKAIKFEAKGEIEKAREARERAAMMTETVEKLRESTPYTYEIEAKALRSNRRKRTWIGMKT